ncbi:uncharacterized protein [Ptychodera flava]|uniref:uncharacterized protein n=1 Tax=Ptychodera flava TaxID=63121 RepID=UPI00396A3C78
MTIQDRVQEAPNQHDEPPPPYSAAVGGAPQFRPAMQTGLVQSESSTEQTATFTQATHSVVHFSSDGTVVVTTSNMISRQPTVRHDEREDFTRQDKLGMFMALCTCILCFWPMGMVAIILSGYAYSYRVRGSSTAASRMTRLSLAASCLTIAIGVTVYATLITRRII